MSGNALPEIEIYADKIIYKYFNEFKNIFQKILLFLTMSSIFTGISGFFMTYIGCILLGIMPTFLVCSMVFLMVFGVYTFDRLTDSKEDTINMPERRNFLIIRRKILLCVAFIAYASSLLISILFGPVALAIILFPLMMNFIYGSRLLPGIPRLKDIPVMKNLAVALSWASVTVLLPFSFQNGYPAALVAIVFYFMLVKDFVNNILYDMRDVKGDLAIGIKTIPIILGNKKTTSLLLLLNTTLLPLLIFLSSSVRVLALLLILYGYFYILYFKERRNPIVLDLVVDGEWLNAFILLLALKVCGLAI